MAAPCQLLSKGCLTDSISSDNRALHWHRWSLEIRGRKPYPCCYLHTSSPSNKGSDSKDNTDSVANCSRKLSSEMNQISHHSVCHSAVGISPLESAMWWHIKTHGASPSWVRGMKPISPWLLQSHPNSYQRSENELAPSYPTSYQVFPWEAWAYCLYPKPSFLAQTSHCFLPDITPSSYKARRTLSQEPTSYGRTDINMNTVYCKPGLTVALQTFVWTIGPSLRGNFWPGLSLSFSIFFKPWMPKLYLLFASPTKKWHL